MFNSNVLSNSAHLGDMNLRNMGGLDVNLSRSFKVKCDGVIELLTYGFRLLFNGNI